MLRDALIMATLAWATAFALFSCDRLANPMDAIHALEDGRTWRRYP